ncbi:MAG: hypothetical protein ABIJ27_00280 [Candidatus Omnitrophota bacterium]
MPKQKQDFQKNLAKVWEATQKQLNTIVKEATVLAKKSEIYIKDISGKGKIEAEILIAKAKREKIYYELGKVVAGTGGKSRDKKVAELRKQIADLRKDMKRNEKLLKS